MTLLFYDGFDHYSTAELSSKYETVNSSIIIDSIGRNGSNGLSTSDDTRYVVKTLGSNVSKVTFGVAIYKVVAGAGNTYQIYLLDNGTTQIAIRFANDGRLIVYRGTTEIGDSGGNTLSIATWYYLECQIYFHNSSGTLELKINENTWINLSSIDTQNTANAYANQIRLGGDNSQTIYYDDLYVVDDIGTEATDFLGDVRAITLFPDSSGTYAQWQVTGSASNYLAVNDTTPDTTTYTYATGSSLKDAFSMDDLSVGDGNIYGIQPLLYARKDDAGSVIIEPITRINGSDYTLGTGSFSLGDTYTYYHAIEELNPDTTGSWTLSDINNIEFGYNRSG